MHKLFLDGYCFIVTGYQFFAVTVSTSVMYPLSDVSSLHSIDQQTRKLVCCAAPPPAPPCHSATRQEKTHDLKRPMAASPPLHLRLKAAICALDVVAACEVGFAAVVELASLRDSDSDSIGIFGDDRASRGSGDRGTAILTALLCVGALGGLVFAIEMWCARSCMTPGKNAAYFFFTAIVVVVVAAVGEIKVLIALLALVPPLIGCGLSVYYRSLLKRERPSRADAEATLMTELFTADNSGTAYRGGVMGVLRVEHPTLNPSHAYHPEPPVQTDAVSHLTADRV